MSNLTVKSVNTSFDFNTIKPVQKQDTTKTPVNNALKAGDTLNISTKTNPGLKKVDVLKGAKAGAATSAKTGALVGLIGGAAIGTAVAIPTALLLGGSTKVGLVVAGSITALGVGVGAASGAVQGGIEGAVYSKLANGDAKKGAVIGGVIGGAVGALSFRQGKAAGIIGVASGALMGSYLGKKAATASVE